MLLPGQLPIGDAWLGPRVSVWAGPGFDQNRLFATVLRKVAPDMSVEAGYMWQVQPATASRGPRHGHTLFAWLTYAP